MEAAVGAGTGTDDAESGPGRAEYDGSCTVPEQHRGLAVTVVQDPRVDVRAHDQCVLGLAVLADPGQQLRTGLQGEDEAGADGVDVEGGGLRRADPVLHQTGGGRLRVVGGGGRHDHPSDVAFADPGVVHRGPRGGGGQVRGRFVRRGAAALANAGLTDDPLGGDPGPFGDLGVGHDVARKVRAGSDDADG